MNYPNNTGFARHSETSRASAEMLDESGAADNQAAFILTQLKAQGLKGATVDEMTIWMKNDGFPKIHNGTVAGRMVNLEKNNHVIKTAVVRKTTSGRKANVYMLFCYSDKVVVESSITFGDLRPLLKAMYQNLEDGKTLRLEPKGEFHQLFRQYFGDAE